MSNFGVVFTVESVEPKGENISTSVVLVQEEQSVDFIASARLTAEFPSDSQVIPEPGDRIVATFSVLAPNGMPKTAGLEGIERQSLTD